MSEKLCKGFLRLSPTQRTEWNARCQMYLLKACVYYALLTKVGRSINSHCVFFFLKGPSQQYTPWLWDFSVSTYISLTNLSRKTQSGEDLKMQSITNVAAEIVMQHSAVTV